MSKDRIRKFSKGLHICESLQLKYKTDLFRIRRMIQQSKQILQIILEIMKLQGIQQIPKNYLVNIAPDKPGLKYIGQLTNNITSHYIIGESAKNQKNYLGRRHSLATFNELYSITGGFEFVSNPLLHTKIDLFSDPVTHNYISYDGDIYYDFFRYYYILHVNMHKQEEYIKRINNYTQAIDNCNEILLETKKILKKEYNQEQLKEILLQYSKGDIC